MLAISISFLIGGLKNDYLFKETHVHKLMSSWVKMVVSSWVDLLLWVQLYL